MPSRCPSLGDQSSGWANDLDVCVDATIDLGDPEIDLGFSYQAIRKSYEDQVQNQVCTMQRINELLESSHLIVAVDVLEH